MTRFHSAAASLGLLPLGLLALVACGDLDEPPAPTETYRVRGLVRQLPEAQGPVREILVHHEAIPDFEDDQGAVLGMEAMTMSLPIADSLELDGIAVGDKVAFDLVVSWDGSPPVSVTRVEKLPPETELDFGN